MGVPTSDIDDVAIVGFVIGFLGGGSNISGYSFGLLTIANSVLAVRTRLWLLVFSLILKSATMTVGGRADQLCFCGGAFWANSLAHYLKKIGVEDRRLRRSSLFCHGRGRARPFLCYLPAAIVAASGYLARVSSRS